MGEQHDNFFNDVDQWKKLLLGDKAQAESYYYENIFQEVIQRFLRRSQVLKKYRYLISLVGFSPQPVILFIKAVRPQRVLFIHSEDTEPYLDLIAEWTGLNLAQVERERVNSSNVIDVYQAIKKFIVAKNPKEILIDITGGKKSMVGGAVMAGNLLEIDTGYVDYDEYLPDLRQPKPGTEYPNMLKNPLVVFGDIEIDKAKEAFNQYNFSRELDILSFLEDKIEDIWQVKILQTLTRIYQEVDTFNFHKAISLANEFIEKYSHRINGPLLEHVKRTLDILPVLVNEKHSDYSPFMCLMLFFSGKRFAERKRYDVAVFLMYRVIELILSFALQEKNIDPSNPIYLDEITEESYNEKLRDAFEREYYKKALPTKIGLMDSAIILLLLHHPVVEELDLKKLKGIISLRNESIFTHGTRPLSKDDFSKIRRMAIKLLDKYLNLKSKPNTVNFENIFSFPKL